MFIILLRSESSIFFTVSPLHDVTCRERNSLFCFRFLSVDYMFSYLLLGLRVLFKNFSFPACSLKMMDCDDSSCDQYKHVYHACTIQTFSEDLLTVTLCVVSFDLLFIPIYVAPRFMMLVSVLYSLPICAAVCTYYKLKAFRSTLPNQPRLN